jgi:hypothetical protein
MNKVSDLKLALACYHAGIVPSLSIYNNSVYDAFAKDYYNNNALQEVEEFINKTGSTEISFAFDADMIGNDTFFEEVYRANNRLIEIIDWNRTHLFNQQVLDRIAELQKQGKQISLKTNRSAILKLSKQERNIIEMADSYLLKGSEGAGQSSTETIRELVTSSKEILKNKASNQKIIASGGVATAQDMRDLLNSGADAVGIGTLFALSEEATIPHEVKLKLLAKTKEDLIKVGTTHRGVMFSSVTEHSNNNLDKSLVVGVKTGQQGHINIGNAISVINEIKPLRDIVEQLVEGLV